MWFRLIAMLFCIVFFINGCNSLISQFFGTHKLRTFTMDEALEKGIGDADFVELTGAWKSGDYIVVPPRTGADKAILIFPLLSEKQMAADAGEKVQPQFIGWTKEFSLDCDIENTCAPRLHGNVLGVVREMQRQKNKAHMLAANKYELSETVNYIEVGREPLAWYWNLLFVAGGIGLAFWIESRANKKRQMAGTAKNL